MKIQDKGTLAVRMGIAILLGCVVGFIFGQKAAFLGEFSLLFIQILKALATPLVFFVIIDGFCKTEIQLKSGFRLLVISTVNATVAAMVALTLTSIFSLKGSRDGELGIHEALNQNEPVSVSGGFPRFDLMKTIGSFVPQSIFEPFVQNKVISVVIFSILLGITLKRLKKKPEISEDIQILERFFSAGNHLTAALLAWIVKGLPFVVFGVVARVVGIGGLGIVTVLGRFVLLVLSGVLIHTLLYYSVVLFVVAKISPIHFFRQAAEALTTAFATGSSLATLPVTLRTLQEKMKISPESSRLAACIGTNLSHNGILLYEAVAALFIADMSGITLSIPQKVILLSTSALAAVGVAGVPDAGLISLSLVLSSVGLPLSLVPALTLVDWLVGRFRAVANVTGDLVVATLLDHFRGPPSQLYKQKESLERTLSGGWKSRHSDSRAATPAEEGQV